MILFLSPLRIAFALAPQSFDTWDREISTSLQIGTEGLGLRGSFEDECLIIRAAAEWSAECKIRGGGTTDGNVVPQEEIGL